MLNKLLRKNKNKKKDSISASNDSKSAPDIVPSISNTYSSDQINPNYPPNPNHVPHNNHNNSNGTNINIIQSSSSPTTNGQRHSHDDMSAEDIKKAQEKLSKKGGQKRHSHIGAMRHHNSFKKQNSKTGKSLNVPGDIKEDDDQQNHVQNGDSHSTEHKQQNGTMSSGNTMAHMMTTAVTNKRLEQLMAMRAGKDAKGNRSRSVNVAKNKEKETQYPKKRRSEVHKEPRRHTMVPEKEKNKDMREEHLKDRRKTIEKRRMKKVQYRVKNELFVLYDYYQPVRIIGSGAYAVVAEAINTFSGKKCAIKKNKGVFDHITDARRILREIKLLMHFDHQDIISLVDVIPCDSTEIDTFNDVYLVMPKMETTLAKVIRSRQKLTDRHYQFFMYQLLRGLNYMHSANVIHRDLKPENILINGADCNVKITDFGLARGVCKNDNIEKPTEYVVTRWYRSPEVMCSAGFYDESVDIWSLGCIFAELILRRPLFPGQNYLDQLKIIFEVMGTPKDLTWIKTPEAKRWVQKLKPHDGKPLKQVFEKASDGALELLSVMLTLDPSQRCSALECLRHSYLKELHRDADEQTCPPFDLSFEFEKAIKTKFGVRHMMYDALTSFQKKNPSPYSDQSGDEN